MARLLLVAGFLISVIVPVGAVAMVVTESSDDQVTIQMPVEASAGGSTAAGGQRTTSSQHATEAFDVFDGEEKSIDPGCADDRNLEDLKQDAVAAAKGLPPLKQVALDAQARFKAFLDQHPEHDLARSDYKTYEELRSTYRRSWRVFDRQVDAFNHMADLYNDALQACSS